MWYTVLITLIIQYSLWLLWRTTEVKTFWIFDMFMHIIFIIQSLWVLYLIYMYILTGDKLENNPETISFINLIKNLVLFLAWILIILNMISIFFIDKIKEVFNLI